APPFWGGRGRGWVVTTMVAQGDTVRRGATLVVLEAMKMELAVEAPRDGIIGDVTVSEGDQVVEGAVLVTFANADSAPSDGDDERAAGPTPAGAPE
ncbi:MAG: acetyl-CoA carboxylase biotin carboxyl carrier protein subunit, partial [Chromatiales bacterium]|nr:acetyl-CoA carboxylase biotin carboxyl carrier protein subunit [Chromatiales bacterium]